MIGFIIPTCGGRSNEATWTHYITTAILQLLVRLYETHTLPCEMDWPSDGLLVGALWACLRWPRPSGQPELERQMHTLQSAKRCSVVAVGVAAYST